MSEQILLSAHELEVGISDIEICSGFNLEVKAGQCWGILGKNGAGKTTLLHTLAGLHPATSGQVSLGHTPLGGITRQEIAQQLGVLLQHSEPTFPGTVMEHVLMGRHPYLGHWQWESSEDIALAEQALATVELAGYPSRQISTLSGGELQRVALATLLTQTPKLYLLDEPTNHLDLHHQIQILDHLHNEVSEQQKGLIMIAHDVNLALRYCDHLILLFGEGEYILGHRDEVISEENLSRLYHHPVQAIPTEGRTVYLPQ